MVTVAQGNESRPGGIALLLGSLPGDYLAPRLFDSPRLTGGRASSGRLQQ